jgi:uncharacterized protein YigE (DUF2233 family)
MRPPRFAAAFILLALLSGCGLSPVPRKPLPPAASPEPPVGAWRAIVPGLEYRELDITVDQRAERLRLARADPQQLRFRVVANDQPRRVSAWLEKEGALLAVNGGYFDPNNRALGLLIHEGVVSGQPYQGFGGMLAVGGEGVRVRWNVAEPYTPDEPLTSGLQNFPMLVLPGGAPNTGIDDNGLIAPRTAVGQDRQGRIVFVVSPGAVFTLTGLGQWLAASDLDLDTALNLDGGSSSGLMLRNGPQPWGVDSWVEVPNAIVIETR